MRRKKKKEKPTWSEVLRSMEVLPTLLGCCSQAAGDSYVLPTVRKGMEAKKSGREGGDGSQENKEIKGEKKKGLEEK